MTASPTRRKSVHLMRRDLRLMEQLVLRRAATLDDLHAAWFAGLSRKRALNRLGELASAGFLHRVTLAVPDALAGPEREQSVYTLGPRARAALELRSLSSEHFRYRRWNPVLRDSSIPHQLVVNRVCDLLGVDAVPEHLLPPAENRAAMQHKPDAIWEREADDGERQTKVLLEVDLGHYSRERIKGKVQSFRRDEEASHLLLVTHTTERADQIARWLNTERFGAAITIASLSELIADPQLARNALPARRQPPQDPFEHVPAVDGLRIPELPPSPAPWCPEEDGWD